MRPRDRALADDIDARLGRFAQRVRPLPGVHDPAYLESFREQLLESVHRVHFVRAIRARPISDRRANPNDELFDPLKAAILQQRRGNPEESFWLVFLFVHFGRNAQGGWRYAREVYGRLGDGRRWDWETTSQNPGGLRQWLDAHQQDLKRTGVAGGFGNHRKYESLDAHSARGTGAAIESYVGWVGPHRSHARLVADALQASDERRAFDTLYHSMSVVASFGRLARFDYLTMLGKLELARIVPGSPYLRGSSGPLNGARRLFGVDETADTLNRWLIELDGSLGVGMQVLEDALCNWNKSPNQFQPFRG